MTLRMRGSDPVPVDRFRWSVLVLALAVMTCTARPPTPAVAPPPARFIVRLDPRDPHALRFEARFVGGRSPALAIDEDMLPAITRVELQRAGRWVALETAHMSAPECVSDCTVRYTVDLARAETSHEGIVAIDRDSFVAPTSTWLMHPSPMPKGSFEVTIDPVTEPPADRFEATPFATGMRRRERADPNHYVMATGDFSEGSYAAFGKLRHRLVESAGGKIEVVAFDAALHPLALSDDELAAWIREDAACVAQLYGRFPVPRAAVFVVPMNGADEVVFGRVLSLGGASIAVLAGTDFAAKDTHTDWVLVHEMVHLGFPTVRERWLAEGLSTYYEPILRERAGWRSAQRVWRGFANEMRRGVPPRGEELALEKRGTIDDIYWGGAIYVMMADVGIRVATRGQKSLDTVLRAILDRGGDATGSWTLDEVLAVAERETKTTVMSDLRQRLAVRGERVDLDAYFAKLGVLRPPPTARAAGPDVKLDDGGEWSWIRKAIEAGDPRH